MPSTHEDSRDLDALVVGEALTDVVISLDGTRSAHPGGSPMNVAVGLARLGAKTALATMLGRDAEGTQIRDHLQQSGVELYASSAPEVPTSSAAATLDSSGAASYDFQIRWDIPMPPVNGARLLHTGSIGSLLEPGASVVRRSFEHAPSRTLLSFDPNVRPAIMGSRTEVVPRVEALARCAHIVKMSDEDASWLYPGISHPKIAEAYAGMGVALFVVTRGPDGCYLRAGDHELDLPAPRVTTEDTIGAGDAYMSGLLHAVLTTALAEQILMQTVDRALLKRAAHTALASAGHTVSRPGANPPDLSELHKALWSYFQIIS